MLHLPRLLRFRRPRRDGVEVIIHGRHSRSWMRALGPKGPAWKGLPEVAAVRHFAWLPSRYRKRLVIPIWEGNVDTMPRDAWALVPSKRARDIFSDKARFAAYAEAQGLSVFVPRTLDIDSNTEFPAVLKCTGLNAGDGIAVVNSRDEIAACRAIKPWAGRPVTLQSVIEGEVDYVTHLVSVGGRIVWHCTYAYPLATSTTIRKARKDAIVGRSALSAADLAVFERFLAPLAYDGPANIDFKRRPDGSVVIFEVNARFGGSLMRPEHTADLAAALAVVLANATPQPDTPAAEPVSYAAQ